MTIRFDLRPNQVHFPEYHFRKVYARKVNFCLVFPLPRLNEGFLKKLKGKGNGLRNKGYNSACHATYERRHNKQVTMI